MPPSCSRTDAPTLSVGQAGAELRFTVKPLGHPERFATAYDAYFAVADTFRVEGKPLLGVQDVLGSGLTPEVDEDAWWAREAVKAMSEAGLAPDQLLTRYEFALMLCAGVVLPERHFPGLQRPADGNLPKPEPFADVHPDGWIAAFLEFLRQYGLVEGFPDRTFKGKRLLTRGELYLLLKRTAELFDAQ